MPSVSYLLGWEAAAMATETARARRICLNMVAVSRWWMWWWGWRRYCKGALMARLYSGVGVADLRKSAALTIVYNFQ